jgi:hypothetical protein
MAIRVENKEANNAISVHFHALNGKTIAIKFPPAKIKISRHYNTISGII